MSGKEKEPTFVEDLGVDNGSSSEKPTVKHQEDVKEDVSPQPKTSKVPYWDTRNVVGANRTASSDESSTAPRKDLPRPGFWRRRWLHYKRHWKLYTLLTVIFLAIFLPLLFLKIFPAIAQRLVDDTSLPIYSASIMNPTPSSVSYSLSSSLKIPAGLTVDLKPIILNLYTNETGPSNPYMRVSLPEYHLKGETAISITNQTATILDQAQFQTFLGNAVNSKQFTLSAGGSTVAYLGALKVPITLNKEVQLNGLNNLDGFTFASAAVVFPAEADGTNLIGTVVLPNPTVVTFELVCVPYSYCILKPELTGCREM
jgi:hypothetical protein